MRTAFYPQQSTCQIAHLWYLYSLFLGEREVGTFVEIGANDGVTASNTWGLAERGWTGWMAEPIPDLAASCRRNHHGHQNVTVVETAVGSSESTEIVLHVAGVLTTGNDELFNEYRSIDWARNHLQNREIVVQSCTLDTFLLNNYVPQSFDVLVVDVEGLESEVFSSFDLDLWSPKIVIVELVDTHPDLASTSISDALLGHKLVSKGYFIVYKDSVNTMFVRTDIWNSAFRK